MKLCLLSTLLAVVASVHSSGNISHLSSKSKRSVYFYLCGTYPNQYYSTRPCPTDVPGPYLCSNTGHYLGLTCTTSSQCTRYFTQSSCIDGYCCTLPVITTTPTPVPVCGGIEPSDGQCYAGGICRVGFFCTRDNACCRCVAGTTAGMCVNGLCPVGYRCNANNYCCAFNVVNPAPLRRCVFGQCPPGYACGPGQLCYEQ